jgi:hypothetical protein
MGMAGARGNLPPTTAGVNQEVLTGGIALCSAREKV